ncbi:MAG: protein kinase domain-containing protein [Planctomycetota bacterium]|jgi:hypothetical protein
MQKYQYQHGDRPLEGFTIERAAGRGGFGEVYYAVSDGGREVALKAVQNYEQIELRGISHCMNLKSPHLVTIFDVKYNERNEPFVIMEYVSGPSLRDLLTESPHGLGVQKAAFFLREIAKSLTYLHECGIVHRDLKPSNIFYENGYVKVGDYGLAKAISASRHSGHTITVGTVHYMAPEIGAGSYNRSIDIYALGVLLYEMLTGDVPFMGSSPAEILMKHMTNAPEVNNIDEPFAHVVKKALAKDPADRYQTIQEMVEDLFGSENIRESVSHFSPDELSVVAGRVAAKANIVETPRPERPRAEVAAEPTREVGKGVVDTARQAAEQKNDVGKEIANTAQRFAQQADAVGQKVAERVDAEAGKLFGTKMRIPGITDPIAPHQRRTLAFMAMVFIAVGAGLLRGPDIFPMAIMIFVMIGVCSKTILFSHQRWFVNLEPESQWISKLVTSGLAALLTSLVGMLICMTVQFSTMQKMFSQGVQPWLSLAIPMLLVNWHRISSPQRAKRLSLGSAVWIGLLGAISAEIFGMDSILIAAVLAGTSLVVQAYSTFGSTAQSKQAAEMQARKAQQKKKETRIDSGKIISRPVPTFVRVFWLLGFFATLGAGLFLVIWAGTTLHGNHFAISLASGVDSLILSLFCFVGACRGRFNGWYRYIIKPGILLICVLTVVASSICMGNLSNLNDAMFLLLLMLIILSSVAFFIIAILPASLFVGGVSRPDRPSAALPKQPAVSSSKSPAGVSSYKRLWALLLAIPGLIPFVGIPLAGLQRFYVGKIGTGILWFLTGGLFGIGQLIDVILICVGQFEDRYGLPLVVWYDSEELKGKTPTVQAADQARAPVRDVAAVKEQRAEAVQVPAKEDSPAKPTPAAPTATVLYEPFHPLAFLFSGLGFVLTFLAIVVGLISALHVPYFLETGWPDPDLAINLKNALGPNWSQLLMDMARIVFIVLMLPAALCVSLGRRHLGARHLIRGIVGLGGLLGAVMLLADGMLWKFRGMGEEINHGELGPILEHILKGLQSEEAVFAAIIFVISVIILSWPAKPRKMMLNPAFNQGVIL